MKAILEIPEKEIKFEFDNLTYNQYRMVGTRNCGIMVERFPIGEPITVLTSNMPNDLKEEINSVIEAYCNH